jgi:tetratricopeptide (TPR) repeat protein
VEAGSIALEVLQQNPDHPCAAHYAIHAFDHPDLARLALPSAKRYAKISPSSHHAQHMPAHIFIQLGMWSDAVDSNINGWKTSVEWVEKKNLSLSKRDYHSLQWLHYSLLQQGLIDQARGIFAIQQKDMKEGIEAQSNLRAGKYYYQMLAASLIETENWKIINNISTPDGWKPKSFSKAGHSFALGFSAAMQGKIEEANKQLLELKAIRKQDFKKNHYKRIEYLKVWELEIKIAIKLYQKDFAAAIKLGNQAILLEDKLPSPSGPPRILKPTYEFLGEIYLKAGKPIEADKYFSISLLRHPNRVRSLIGSARAADAKRDIESAKEKYHKLFVQLENATPDFPELKEAKEFLRIN